MDQLYKIRIVITLTWWLHIMHVINLSILNVCVTIMLHRWHDRIKSYFLNFFAKQIHLRNLVYSSDITYINQIQINSSTLDKHFSILDILGGLKPIQIYIYIYIFLLIMLKTKSLNLILGGQGDCL